MAKWLYSQGKYVRYWILATFIFGGLCIILYHKNVGSSLDHSQYRINAAIYYLIRSTSVDNLNISLHSLDKYFNNRFHYPVIIFHEGTLSEEGRFAIQDMTQSLLIFQQVTFTLPDVITDPVPETVCFKQVGYRHMCRFHAKGVYEESIMSHLDYVWRLDDDSILLSHITYDIFQYLSDHNLLYGYVIARNDLPHCVHNLWKTVKHYISTNSIQTQFFDKWPENKIYYNNFEVSAMRLWRSQEYQHYMDMIDHIGGIYYHRWGDAPIKSIAVSMFVPENQVHRFRGFGYNHNMVTI